MLPSTMWLWWYCHPILVSWMEFKDFGVCRILQIESNIHISILSISIILLLNLFHVDMTASISQQRIKTESGFQRHPTLMLQSSASNTIQHLKFEWWTKQAPAGQTCNPLTKGNLKKGPKMKFFWNIIIFSFHVGFRGVDCTHHHSSLSLLDFGWFWHHGTRCSPSGWRRKLRRSWREPVGWIWPPVLLGPRIVPFASST